MKEFVGKFKKASCQNTLLQCWYVPSLCEITSGLACSFLDVLKNCDMRKCVLKAACNVRKSLGWGGQGCASRCISFINLYPKSRSIFLGILYICEETLGHIAVDSIIFWEFLWICTRLNKRIYCSEKAGEIPFSKGPVIVMRLYNIFPPNVL